ncbi:MAG: 2OG-Fe(II) oxygenase family protein, partial [Pseudomonadales bacterium]
SVSETAVGAVQRDLKEFFQMGPDTVLPEPLASLVAEYRSHSWALGLALLDSLEQSLQSVSEGTLAEGAQGLSGRLSEQQSLLRVVHYPPLDADAGGATRAAAHEDINLLTILPVAQEPGLQVRDQGGNWHPVHGSSGHLIVNAGDMLAEATGGFIRSTSHRVVNPTDPAARARSRIAAPYFLAPEPDTVLSNRYTAGAYLEERLALIGLSSPSAPAKPPR